MGQYRIIFKYWHNWHIIPANDGHKLAIIKIQMYLALGVSVSICACLISFDSLTSVMQQTTNHHTIMDVEKNVRVCCCLFSCQNLDCERRQGKGREGRKRSRKEERHGFTNSRKVIEPLSVPSLSDCLSVVCTALHNYRSVPGIWQKLWNYHLSPWRKWGRDEPVHCARFVMGRYRRVNPQNNLPVVSCVFVLHFLMFVGQGD